MAVGGVGVVVSGSSVRLEVRGVVSGNLVITKVSVSSAGVVVAAVVEVL